MLIRNATSLHDLNNKKKLQAEILQMQIDNEAIKEQRVSDFKNPNKPPPIPPQYKTSTEIQKDVMEQQKQTIDNLKSLGLDGQTASQIAIDMKNLKEGDESYLKFNKFFPSFKTKIEKNVNVKAIGVDGMIEEIRRQFYNIDNAMGLNLKGTNATNYFGNDTLNAKSLLGTQQDYGDLITVLRGLYDTEEVRDGVNEQKFEILLKMIDSLYRIAPSDEELQAIDTFTLLERTMFNRDVETLIKIYNIPSKEFFNNVQSSLSRELSPENVLRLISIITKNIGAVGDAGEKKLEEFKENILKEQQKLFDIGTLYTPQNILQLKQIERLGGAQALQDFGGIERLQEIQKLGDVNLTSAVRSQVDKELKFVYDTIQSYKPPALIKRITNKKTQQIEGIPIYEDRYIQTPPTIDGGEPNYLTNNQDNLIYFRRVGHAQSPQWYLRNGQIIEVKDYMYKLLGYNPQNGQWEDEGAGDFDIGFFLYKINGSGKMSNMHTIESMKNYIWRKEKGIIEEKLLREGNNYRPSEKKGRIIENVIDSSTVIDSGDNKEKEGWGVKYKKKSKSKKYDSDSSSDEMRDIHIDINSHNGKDYKMSGDGFIKRRIKIGKGIELKKDEPKFRAFGKYIIHMPQLHNQNILNFKHKSGGTIPSIKPVNINDNFKDFVLDVLESGKVNDRHYESLTDAEKNHFLKVVRGAGIINDLKLKNSNDDKEKEDIERLELLIGEYNAGNDNANMIKEAKVLIKKYVSNGRISRQKGLEMLMEFD